MGGTHSLVARNSMTFPQRDDPALCYNVIGVHGGENFEVMTKGILNRIVVYEGKYGIPRMDLAFTDSQHIHTIGRVDWNGKNKSFEFKHGEYLTGFSLSKSKDGTKLSGISFETNKGRKFKAKYNSFGQTMEFSVDVGSGFIVGAVGLHSHDAVNAFSFLFLRHVQSVHLGARIELDDQGWTTSHNYDNPTLFKNCTNEPEYHKISRYFKEKLEVTVSKAACQEFTGDANVSVSLSPCPIPGPNVGVGVGVGLQSREFEGRLHQRLEDSQNGEIQTEYIVVPPHSWKHVQWYGRREWKIIHSYEDLVVNTTGGPFLLRHFAEVLIERHCRGHTSTGGRFDHNRRLTL